MAHAVDFAEGRPAATGGAFGRLDHTVMAFVALCTAVMLIMLLWMGGYGFDFTDESFYLVSMNKPFGEFTSITQFRFIYYPFSLLLGGDIALLRQFNILLTFGLAWVLCDLFLRQSFQLGADVRACRRVLSACLATAGLVFFVIWLPVPNYNALALQSALIVVVGWLLMDRVPSRANLTGWLIVGVGGWLAFMAKPTTAALLGACTLLYVLAAGKWRWPPLLMAVLVALALVVGSAFVIDGSIGAFIQRLNAGVEAGAALGGGHNMGRLWRFDPILMPPHELYILAGLGVAVCLLTLLAGAQRIWVSAAGRIAVLAFPVLALIIVWQASFLFIYSPFRGLLILAAPLGTLIAVVLLRAVSGQPTSRRPCRHDISLFVCMLLVPYAYTFGTIRNYWEAASQAAIFWALAGLLTLPRSKEPRVTLRRLLPAALCVQLVCVVVLGGAMQRPYRQPQPLWQNSDILQVGPAKSSLRLSSAAAQYIADLRATAVRAGLEPGTPMIDLTGESPGTLYVLEAENVGRPWLLGGYPGSNLAARRALARVPCDKLLRAWLLTEPEGRLRLSVDALPAALQDIRRHYERVGVVLAPRPTEKTTRSRQQELWRPLKREPFVGNCQ